MLVNTSGDVFLLARMNKSLWKRVSMTGHGSLLMTRLIFCVKHTFSSHSLRNKIVSSKVVFNVSERFAKVVFKVSEMATV